MPEFEQYEHHGNDVWVRKELKGKHREYCLCFSCQRLDIMDPENNCVIAKKIFQLCIENELVLAVWECPEFLEQD